MDMIDQEEYRPPEGPVRPLDPADAALFVKDQYERTSSGLEVRIKSRGGHLQDRHLSWLEKPMHLQNNLYDNWEKKRDFEFQKEQRMANTIAKAKENLTREDQMDIIEKTFDFARQTPVHPVNPNIKAVKTMEIFPHQSIDHEGFTWVAFDTAPAELLKDSTPDGSEGKQIHSSFLRSYTGSHHALYTPDPANPPEGTKRNFKWLREYFKNPTPTVNELNNFYFTIDGDAVVYNRFQHRLSLRIRTQTANDPHADEEIVSRPHYATLDTAEPPTIEEKDELGAEDGEEDAFGDAAVAQTVEDTGAAEGEEETGAAENEDTQAKVEPKLEEEDEDAAKIEGEEAQEEEAAPAEPTEDATAETAEAVAETTEAVTEPTEDMAPAAEDANVAEDAAAEPVEAAPEPTEFGVEPTEETAADAVAEEAAEGVAELTEDVVAEPVEGEAELPQETDAAEGEPTQADVAEGEEVEPTQDAGEGLDAAEEELEPTQDVAEMVDAEGEATQDAAEMGEGVEPTQDAAEEMADAPEGEAIEPTQDNAEEMADAPEGEAVEPTQDNAEEMVDAPEGEALEPTQEEMVDAPEEEVEPENDAAAEPTEDVAATPVEEEVDPYAPNQ